MTTHRISTLVLVAGSVLEGWLFSSALRPANVQAQAAIAGPGRYQLAMSHHTDDVAMVLDTNTGELWYVYGGKWTKQGSPQDAK